jgi:hypothetical protein
MKYLFTPLIFLLSCRFSAAQHVNFETSLKVAFEKASQQKKLVFIEYYNAECPVCKKVEPVFDEKEMAAFYNEHFISYKLNTENIKKEDSLFIANSTLRFESVPWFLFFNTAGKLVHYSGAKNDVTYVVDAGKTALDPANRTEDLVNKYNSGDRSIKTLYAYSNLLALYKNDSMRAIIADELFKAFPKEDLGNEKSYVITKNAVNSIENGFFKYWIEHIPEIKAFEKNAKAAHEINVLGDILQKSINSNERKNWGLAKIRLVKQMILQTEMSKDPDAFFWEQESTLLVKENLNDEAITLFDRRIASDSGAISPSVYTITHFLNLFTDKTYLGMIKVVIDKLSAKKASKSEKADLMYANILYYKKINDKKTEARLAHDAINFYKANSIDDANLKLLVAGLSY